MNKEFASIMLKEMIECAKEAGIYDHFYPAYGTLLGIVRENDFISHDGDMDVIIDTDRITPKQARKYVDLLRSIKMYKFRWKCQKRVDNGHYLWVSIKKFRSGPKCCNWFGFRHNGFFWHSKGKKWLVARKFDPKKIGHDMNHHAICKGVPEDPFKKLIDLPKKVSKNFYNIQCKIPAEYGKILDIWYPDWIVPRKGGTSEATVVMRIKNWKNKKSWVIMPYK